MIENKLFKIVAVSAFISLSPLLANAQGLAINATGSTADASAMLDVSSTSQGVLVPRMTAAQRTAIAAPATGLLVYQTDGTAGFYFYNGTAWTSLNGGGGSPTGAAGGSLTGTYPNPSLATGSVGITQHSATGTASSSTFLRGDNTWATPTATPSGAAGGDLTGTFPNPALVTSGVTAGTYGSSAQVPAYVVDAKGRITAAANINIVLANANISSTAAIAYSKLNLAGSIMNSDISATAAIAYSKLSVPDAAIPVAKLNVGGTASATKYLDGTGNWSTPAGGGGSSVPVMITNASATPISVDFSASTTTKTFVINRGGTGGAFTCNLTLPASSNYSDGDMILVMIVNNNTGQMTTSLLMPGVTSLLSYAVAGAVDVSSSFTTLTGTGVAFLKLVRINATTWCRTQ